MKLQNVQSNFQGCCQKTQKLKPYCLKKTLKLLERSANYLDNSKYVSCKSKVDPFYKKKKLTVLE